MRPDNRRFRLTDPKTDADIMGGTMGIDNPYVLGYSSGVNAGDKGPGDLEIGESVLRVYSMSGQGPHTYRLVRVEDYTREERLAEHGFEEPTEEQKARGNFGANSW